MKLTVIAAALAASSILLVACGGDTSSGAAAASTSLAPYKPPAGVREANEAAAASKSAAAAAASASAASASAAASAPHTAGEEVKTTFGSVTYFGQKRPAAPKAPAPEAEGTEWVAIDVQVCDAAGGQGGTIQNDSWLVRDANNGQNSPSSTTYSQFPAPRYPSQQDIDAGTCVRGWIVYPIVKGQPLVSVRYQSASQPAPISWAA